MWSSNGRIRRKTFWKRFFITILISFVGGVLSEIFGGPGSNLGRLIYFFTIFTTDVFIIIQGIKRIHDLNKSGWFVLIPIYNLVLFLTKGTKGDNKYGADPR